MQQPNPDHTQPSIQFTNQPQMQQPHMMLCPVQFIYEPQMLVPPDEQVQPSPTHTFQNQPVLIQNTPPWIQNRTNMVYMPQMQITNNLQSYIPQHMVQNPMFNFQYQPMIMQQEQIRHMVPNFVNQNLVNQQMVQNLMHPQTMVQHPQHLVQNPQHLVQNPQHLAQNPQHLVQNPQALVQNPQLIVQNSQPIVQNPQTLTQNSQPMAQNPQPIIQNSQTMVRNPPNVLNSQSIIQNPVRFQIDQKQESPLLSQILKGHTSKPVPKHTEIPAKIHPTRLQYQNVPQMIILNPIKSNFRCAPPTEPPVTTNEQSPNNEIPQHIKNQIPEGLSVKTVFKIPATAMVKPTEYILQNIAPADDAHPRVYPKPVVTPVSNRDPQTNYKRKIKELTEQNAKDESEVKIIKRNMQEATNAQTKVKIYLNIPPTIVDAQNNEGTGLVNGWRPPNTLNTPVDRPQKIEKLLRNTVYVQARGRVDETLQNDTQKVNNANQNNAKVKLDGPNKVETEINSSAQVYETNRLQEKEDITVAVNNSQYTDEALSNITLSNDKGGNMCQNNAKLNPSLLSNDTDIDINENCSKITSTLKSSDVDDTVTRNNSKIRSLLSNDKIHSYTKIAETLPNGDSCNVSKKPKTSPKVNKIKRVNTEEMVSASDKLQTIEQYILTHVLDGHIIQESNVPFIVQKPTLTPIKPISNRTEDNETSNDKKTESSKKEESVQSSNIEQTEISLDKEETVIPKLIKDTAERESFLDSEPDEDDPFQHLSHSTVKSWTVCDLSSHLMHHQSWRESAQKLFDEEVDGESLLLVNKEQLIKIGICERHVEVLSDFLEDVQ